MVFKTLTTTLFLSLIVSANNDIKFKAKSLIIHLPDKIIASGNTSFNNNELSVSANNFRYQIKQGTATFQNNVNIKYNESSLSGDNFNINNITKNIDGKGNIKFISPKVSATSQRLTITDNKILRLHKNVDIQQNGSQINSDELIYNLMTDTIISNQRIKLKISE